MVSVERVLEYCHLPPESELEIKKTKPSKEWPQYGIISGEKLCFCYHSSLPVVLKDLYFCIRSKEKVRNCGAAPEFDFLYIWLTWGDWNCVRNWRHTADVRIHAGAQVQTRNDAKTTNMQSLKMWGGGIMAVGGLGYSGYI